MTCAICGETIEIVDETIVVPAPPPASVGYGSATEQEEQRQRFGRFELVERVGAGSFGTVWKARDRELERIVALKIPRSSQLDSEHIDQFLREAQAAAQLQHPHIVSVHEVCRDGELVGVVSDFIEGQPLDERLTVQPLTSRESIELCMRICEALEHAHDKGVIHRDLKPSNIMLRSDGTPHIMDFGLAKRVSADVTMTVEGQILGTPAYMPPEQARGEGHLADARADVYSAGVILFELLTGERPFRGNLRMLLHQVIHEEAPSPRGLNSNISRDLDTICLKCLEKSPDRRYRSARELLDELRRCHKGEPILARPITRLDRTWRWCLRKPGVAGLSLALSLLLLVVSVAAPVVAWNESRLRREAEDAHADAERSASEAELARIDAQQSADTATAINDFILLDMLGAPNPYGEGAGHRVTVVEALESAEGRVEERFEGTPAIEAAVRDVLGKTYAGLGEMKEAIDQADAAWQLRRSSLGDNHPDTLHSQSYLGGVLNDDQQFDRAEEILRDVMVRCEAQLGTHNYETISARINLGNTLQIVGRHEESDALLGRAIEEIAQYHPERYHGALSAISNLAASLFARGRLSDAEKWSRRQIELARETSQHQGLLSGLNTLANIYISAEKYDAAIEIQDELLEVAEPLLPPGHWHLAFMRLSRAVALVKMGNELEAIPIYVTVYQDLRDSLGPDNYQTVRSLTELVDLLEKHDRIEQLDPYREAFMYSWLRTANRNEPDKVDRAVKLYLEKTRQNAEFSDEAFRQGLLDYKEEHLPEGHDRRGQYASNLGSWLLEQNDYARAEPLLLESYATWQGNAGDEEHAPWQRSQLRKLYEGMRLPDEAAKYVDDE